MVGSTETHIIEIVCLSAYVSHNIHITLVALASP
jgi:hypothetical protein